MLNNPQIRINPDRKTPPKVMYRGFKTLDSILEMSRNYTQQELEERLKYEKRFEAGSCTSSCEGIPEGFSMPISDLGKENLRCLLDSVITNVSEVTA